MARFQRQTVPWCSRSSSSGGTLRQTGASLTNGSSGWCCRTLSVNSSSAPPRNQPVPNPARAWPRRRPAPSRSSTDCLNSAILVSSQSRRPRNTAELPTAASTGAVASWAAL
jgi:hypothetical protein